VIRELMVSRVGFTKECRRLFEKIYGKVKNKVVSPMFEGLFQPMHLLVILGIALLVFGPKKLPELGKWLGDGIRGFRSAMREIAESTDAQFPKP
jgi:sec-independent protein translocase protein TatA